MGKILTCLLILAAMLGLPGCGQEKQTDIVPEIPVAAAVHPEEDAAERRIGVALPTKELQRWNQDGTNIRTWLEDSGYTVELRYADNDIATQISQIEDMINNGCQVLVIAAVDGETLGVVLDHASRAGIPVIAYDRLIMNSDAVSYYVTFDSREIGAAQGRYIVEALDLDNARGRTYTIEYITGDPGDHNVKLLREGALSVLQPYIDAGTLICPSGQTDLADIVTAGWSADRARQRFEKLLSGCYGEAQQLDAVLASNDSTAQGVAEALETSYTGPRPVLTGQDCDIASVRNILAGKQSMSVFKDTRILASRTAQLVDALMTGMQLRADDTQTYDNGVKAVPTFRCEPVVCTAENVYELLIDSGYYTEEDLKAERSGTE